MKLVSYAEVVKHLRLDTDADRSDVELKIEASSAAVISYLNAHKDPSVYAAVDSNGDIIVDSNGDPVSVKKQVMQATLMTVGYFYRERDGSNEYKVDAQFGFGYELPAGPAALLYSLRVPTLA